MVPARGRNGLGDRGLKLKKVVLLAVAAALSVIAIASFSGCALSALSSQSKPADVDDGMTTVERDGYSFRCPSDWEWEKYTDDSIICNLIDENRKECILLQEVTVKYGDPGGAISLDGIYDLWVKDNSEKTYKGIEEFSVGGYDWVKAIEKRGDSENNMAIGSVSSTKFLIITYIGGDQQKHKAEFNSMIDSIKLI